MLAGQREARADSLSPCSFANPEYIKRLDCSVVHGQIGRGTCEVNAIKRWLYGFRDSAVIYLPVRLVEVVSTVFILLTSLHTGTSHPTTAL